MFRKLIILGTIFFWVSMIWYWQPSILTLTVDDSYYYLKTAINASKGYGFTFDQLNITNGFHPLWMFILTSIFTILHENIAFLMRFVLTLQLFIAFSGIFILQKALEEKQQLLLFIFAILSLNFYYTKIYINGLESALQCFFLCTMLAYWIWLESKQKIKPSYIFYLGLLGGLTFLSRLNTIFFILPLFCMFIFFPLERKRNNTSCIYLSVAFLILVVPYFCWNYFSFGHFMPVSGAIKAEHIRHTYSLIGISLVILLLLLGIIYFYITSLLSSKSKTLYFIFPLVFYSSAETIYDIGWCGLMVPNIWYLVPEGLLLLLSIFFIIKKSKVAIRYFNFILLGYFILSIFIWIFRMNPSSYMSYTAAYKASSWVASHTNQAEIIAGWDSGITGAFSNRRLINLDGLINSWDYKENYLDTNNVDKFITKVEPVNYIIQTMPMSIFYRLKPFARYRGVDLSTWSVVYLDCFSFSSVIMPWQTQKIAYLVLSKKVSPIKYTDLFDGNIKFFCAHGI